MVLTLVCEIKMSQRNHARHVEASKIQVHLLIRHTLCFHTDPSLGRLRLLGVWRPAAQPL